MTIMVNQKLFPITLSTFGFYPIAYFYAVILAVLTLYGWLTIKDTDKLSLLEVQCMYKKNMQESTSESTEPLLKE